MPPLSEQRRWEEDHVSKQGDGASFPLVSPEFEDYFETVRKLAGEPVEDGKGRRLPRFDRGWMDAFNKGHDLRKKWWREQNERARKELTIRASL